MVRFIAALLFAALVAGTHGAQERLTADEIARRVQDRNAGRDSRSTMRMKLYDRRDRVRDRGMTLLSLRGRGTPGAGPKAPEGDRMLIRFTYPDDIRGTGFLVLEHPDAEDERFLYLPSLGRVRRIAGSETQESFVGSDFTYEDIGGRELDEYTYAILDEHASWTPPSAGGAAASPALAAGALAHPALAAGAEAHPALTAVASAKAAWRLESKRKDASAEFPRVVSLILKDSYFVVSADIYNRRNEKQKVYTVRRLEQVQGVWTAMDAVMTNAVEKSRTELLVAQVEYNVGLQESDFTRRELERGAK